MDLVFEDFRKAYEDGNGYNLSMTLSPIAPTSQPDRLSRFYRSTNFQNVQNDFKYRIMHDANSSFRLPADEGNGWVEVYHTYWKAVGEIVKAESGGENASYVKVYEAWKEMTNALIRGYTNCNFEAWTVPCLYVAGKYLRVFAIKADESAAHANGTSAVKSFQDDDFNPEAEKNEKLEDAARVLNKIFTTCLSDRAPLEESRKWGIYNIINLLFKTYFRLNSISLSKNILNAIQAYRGDMPSLDAFPKAHRVTFKYYVGVIKFLEESYEEAEKHLTEAWLLCHKDSIKNKELILTYLIPCHLLTTHTLPSLSLLAPYPRLQTLFLPLSRCIKSGDLSGFDAALVAGEDEFTKRRIYLTLERGRDIALRNLLRKVFLAGGFEEGKEGVKVRRTRIPVQEFAAAISLGSHEMMDTDEVECLVANMIYKNLMKGYIARERGIIVLSKGGAFPGTGV